MFIDLNDIIEEVLEEEPINQNISKMITEEMHIAAAVSWLADVIFSDLLNSIKSCQYKRRYTSNNPPYSYKEGTFVITVNKNNFDIINDNNEELDNEKEEEEEKVEPMDVHINWTLRNYYNVDTYNRRNVMNNSFNYSTKEGNSINIHLSCIDGHLDRYKVMEGLQHEVAHFYEVTKYGQKYNDVDLYKFANEYLQHPVHNKFVMTFASIIYVSRKYEGTAYTNETYRYLISTNDYPFRYRNAIKKTALYSWVKGLEHDIKLLSDPNADKLELKQAENIFSPYGLTLKKVIKIGERAIDDLTRRMGYTIVKAIKDYEEQNKNNKKDIEDA